MKKMKITLGTHSLTVEIFYKEVVLKSCSPELAKIENEGLFVQMFDLAAQQLGYIKDGRNRRGYRKIQPTRELSK